MLRQMAAAAALATAALALGTCPGFGWGNEGHEIIATIAANVLQEDSPATLEKIKAILADDNGNDWTPNWDQTDIASEATWADVCRETSTECRNVTQLWHFVDIDFDHANVDEACFGHHAPDGEASQSPVQACVTEKIEQFKKELADPQTSPEERLLALKFLLHFVGDIHQPLHAVSRTEPGAAHGDFGANCVGILRGNAKNPQRLHSYWDTALVQRALKKDVDQAADALMPLVNEHKDDWSAGSPADWANESYALAHSSAYAGVIDTDPVQTDYMFRGRNGPDERCGPSKVYKINTQKYDKQAMQTVREQLAKAGLRLARLLQESVR
jgi:hypothetical protein